MGARDRIDSIIMRIACSPIYSSQTKLFAFAVSVERPLDYVLRYELDETMAFLKGVSSAQRCPVRIRRIRLGRLPETVEVAFLAPS